MLTVGDGGRVLQVMVSEGIADSIEVDAEIPNRGTIYLSVKVNEPEEIAGQDFIYALNWDEQRVNIINTEYGQTQEVRLHTYVSDSDETFISDIGEVYISDSYLV